MAWTRFIAFAPLRHLVEQQQPLIQQCYPCDGEQDGMTKPDQHTAERIYAKLQQLKVGDIIHGEDGQWKLASRSRKKACLCIIKFISHVIVLTSSRHVV